LKIYPIENLIAFRKQLSKSSKKRFEIRTHKSIPFGSAIIIDYDSTFGKIQIETKPYKQPLKKSFAF